MEHSHFPFSPSSYMSPEDLAAISFHLRTALAVLERQKRLTSGDISAKSLLNVLLREVEAKAVEAERLVEEGK